MWGTGRTPQLHTRTICAAEGGNGSGKKSLRDIIEEEAGEAGVGGFEAKQHTLSPEQEFELNRGFAIDMLLQDYPYILDREPDFSIFHKQVVLEDTQGFSIRGKQAYQLFFGLLRRLKRALFANTCVSVLLMDKYSTDKSQIRLRWKIEAGERLPDIDRAAMLQSMGFDSVDKLKASGSGDILEGISVYKLDAEGIITSHKIQVTQPTIMAPLQALKERIPLALAPNMVPNVYPR